MVTTGESMMITVGMCLAGALFGSGAALYKWFVIEDKLYDGPRIDKDVSRLSYVRY